MSNHKEPLLDQGSNNKESDEGGIYCPNDAKNIGCDSDANFNINKEGNCNVDGEFDKQNENSDINLGYENETTKHSKEDNIQSNQIDNNIYNGCTHQTSSPIVEFNPSDLSRENEMDYLPNSFNQNHNQNNNFSINNPDNISNTIHGLNNLNYNNEYPAHSTNHDPNTLESSIQSSQRSTSTIKVYSRRWYMLFLFSAVAFVQGALIDVYQVIAQSAEAAFGWTDATVSLMQNWIYLTYVVGVIPFSWLIDAKGMRISVIICAFLTFLGALFRCLTTSQPLVTWFANLGNIFVGFGGPVAFTAGPVMSSLWFPPDQRTTATAIGTIAGFVGPCATFVIGPFFVDVPTLGNASREQCNKNVCSNYTVTEYTNIDTIKHQMLYQRYAECGLCALVLVMCVIYFPSKPPQPPSLSAALEKVSFFGGIKHLFRRENGNFWLVCFAYMLTAGLYDIWSSLMDVNLKSFNVAEDEAGLIAALAIFTGSIGAILIGRTADLLSGYMKLLSVVLVCVCALSTYWFLLVCQYIRPFSNVQLYASAILQGLCINSPIPLFYEMAIESNYPINETVTSGVMSLVYNIFPLLFLGIFWIPNISTDWMNWFMYCCVLLAVPLILLFKEKSKRMDVDKAGKIDSE